MARAGYIVFEPPAGTGGEPVFVRDGFHLLAFLVPVLWFLFYRMWIEAALCLALVLGLAVLERVAGAGFALPAVSFLVSLAFGLEAPALRMAALRRRGFCEWGAVQAADREEAALRYFGEAGDLPAAPPVPVSAQPRLAVRHAPAAPVLGLLGYPGGR